jgi:branched-chain amino acid transport system permease protein
MGEILQYVLSGLSLGGIYALVAIGFYIMWEATKTANFTHGDVYMFGAVLAVVFVGQGLPLVLAAILAVAAATITGLLVERVFVRPFNKEVNATAWMLTTIAVGIMIESGVTITYGPLGRPLPSPLAERPVRFGGAGIYPQELLLPVATIVVMVALEAFYRRTTLAAPCGRSPSTGPWPVSWAST